ncbi:MAG: proline--tRNA ligase [Candidatus Pristimantibacillus lignocellulolyticus]|uniref:Proline--tRNA ligase n=1 Tax=Candidatus Pristimantibacillus lignocellulolyticus TaxID=2994561 RepID=A0A9J6ZC84_9BACL|nr:MAG: proline--tRNA ligase [Candidatus Pristimantibacillus lignocellulolyticus]
MKQSKLLLSTLRESPSDAEVVSHQLMVRAGYIRQLAAGIYAYLPLGRKVLQRIENIIRQEMDRSDAQELLMPAIQPIELWKESGRNEVYGPELMRISDRHNREFALGPTHEEVITSLVRNEINSYRKLPVTLYQIQTKFRDERRPRFGLLRGREFLMKDAYSFDTDWEGLDNSYQSMYDAYHRIFTRIGLNYRAVEADAGAIGGEGGTHEFMALADIGEDTIAACSSCEYAANLEKAEASKQTSTSNVQNPLLVTELEQIHTPNTRTIDELVQFLQVDSSQILKTLLYIVDNAPVAVVVRGDHDVNEIKVSQYMSAETIMLAEKEQVEQFIKSEVGYIGPIGLNIPILIDASVLSIHDGIAGANVANYHYRHVNVSRDLDQTHVADFRNVVEGDSCPRCEQGTLQLHRGIEIGHVFKLGTKYSEKLSATFLDQSGRDKAMIMGCYGIGVSRILSAVVEQHHDEHGIIWPTALTPYHVHIIVISTKDEIQMQLVQQLETHLEKHGVEILIDDRDERPGVTFKDSDLIGIPYRIVVGKDAIHGNVEWVERRSITKELISADDAIQRVIGNISR